MFWKRNFSYWKLSLHLLLHQLLDQHQHQLHLQDLIDKRSLLQPHHLLVLQKPDVQYSSDQPKFTYQCSVQDDLLLLVVQ